MITMFLILLVVNLFMLGSILDICRTTRPANCVSKVVGRCLRGNSVCGLGRSFNIGLSVCRGNTGFGSTFGGLLSNRGLGTISSTGGLSKFSRTCGVGTNSGILVALCLGGSSGTKRCNVGNCRLNGTRFGSSVYGACAMGTPSSVGLLMGNIRIGDRSQGSLRVPSVLASGVNSGGIVARRSFGLSNFLASRFSLGTCSTLKGRTSVTGGGGICAMDRVIPRSRLGRLGDLTVGSARDCTGFVRRSTNLKAITRCFSASARFCGCVGGARHFI